MPSPKNCWFWLLSFFFVFLFVQNVWGCTIHPCLLIQSSDIPSLQAKAASTGTLSRTYFDRLYSGSVNFELSSGTASRSGARATDVALRCALNPNSSTCDPAKYYLVPDSTSSNANVLSNLTASAVASEAAYTRGAHLMAPVLIADLLWDVQVSGMPVLSASEKAQLVTRFESYLSVLDDLDAQDATDNFSGSLQAAAMATYIFLKNNNSSISASTIDSKIIFYGNKLASSVNDMVSPGGQYDEGENYRVYMLPAMMISLRAWRGLNGTDHLTSSNLPYAQYYLGYNFVGDNGPWFELGEDSTNEKLLRSMSAADFCSINWLVENGKTAEAKFAKRRFQDIDAGVPDVLQRSDTTSFYRSSNALAFICNDDSLPSASTNLDSDGYFSSSFFRFNANTIPPHSKNNNVSTLGTGGEFLIHTKLSGTDRVSFGVSANDEWRNHAHGPVWQIFVKGTNFITGPGRNSYESGGSEGHPQSDHSGVILRDNEGTATNDNPYRPCGGDLSVEPYGSNCLFNAQKAMNRQARGEGSWNAVLNGRFASLGSVDNKLYWHMFDNSQNASASFNPDWTATLCTTCLARKSFIFIRSPTNKPVIYEFDQAKDSTPNGTYKLSLITPTTPTGGQIQGPAVSVSTNGPQMTLTSSAGSERVELRFMNFTPSFTSGAATYVNYSVNENKVQQTISNNSAADYFYYALPKLTNYTSPTSSTISNVSGGYYYTMDWLAEGYTDHVLARKDGSATLTYPSSGPSQITGDFELLVVRVNTSSSAIMSWSAVKASTIVFNGTALLYVPSAQKLNVSMNPGLHLSIPGWLQGDASVSIPDSSIFIGASTNLAIPGTSPAISQEVRFNDAGVSGSNYSISNNTLTFGTVTSPPPSISNISPSSVTQNSTNTIMITGTNFSSPSVTITIGSNSVPLTPSNISSTQLQVSLTANQTNLLGSGSGLLSVSQTSGNASIPFSITPAASPPSISSVSPSSVTQGTSNSIIINGTNFQSGATVQVVINSNSVTLSNPAIAAGQITATLTSNQTNTLGAGTGTITVSQPSGNASASFSIVPAPVIPSIVSISPNAVTRGASGTFTLFGNNFVSNAQVWVGPTLVQSPTISITQITFSLASQWPQIANGNNSVTVTQNSQTSNAVTLSVAAAPALTSVNPSSPWAYGNTSTITLTGTSFPASAQVSVGPLTLTPAIVNSTTATFSLSSLQWAQLGTGTHALNLIVDAGAFQVSSNALSIVVNPQAPTVNLQTPTNASSLPNNLPVSFSATIGQLPSGNVAISLYLNPNASPTIGNAAQIIHQTNIVASGGGNSYSFAYTPPGGWQNTTYYWQLVASNGVTTTNTAIQTFIIIPPQPSGPPSISSITPASIQYNTTNNILISGTNFASNTGVTINSPNANISIVNPTINLSASPHTISFSLSAANTVSLGPGATTISLSQPSGSTSGGLSITIPGPTILSLNPNAVFLGTAPSFTINGSNFFSGTNLTVQIGSLAIVPTINSSSQLAFSLSAVQLSSLGVGTANVLLTSNGGSSSSLPLSISAPVPTISSITPSTFDYGSSTAFTITGTNFVPGTSIQFGTISITPSSVSPTQLQATLSQTASSSLSIGSNPVVISQFGQSSTGSHSIILAPLSPSLTLQTPTPGASFNTTDPVNFGATLFQTPALNLDLLFLLSHDVQPDPLNPVHQLIVLPLPASPVGNFYAINYIPPANWEVGTYYWQIAVGNGYNGVASGINSFTVSAAGPTCGGSAPACPNVGVCQGFSQICGSNNQWQSCNAPNFEQTEISCNDSFDNDCDGLADDADPDCITGLVCTPSTTTTCTTGLPGICSAGTQTCNATGTVQGACGGIPVGGVAEVCQDNQDNDCDGLSDCSDADCSATSACSTNPPVQAFNSFNGGGGGGGGGGGAPRPRPLAAGSVATTSPETPTASDDPTASSSGVGNGNAGNGSTSGTGVIGENAPSFNDSPEGHAVQSVASDFALTIMLWSIVILLLGVGVIHVLGLF